MKRTTILLLILMGTAVVSTAQSSIKGHEYILSGELINTFTLPPGCGVMAFAIVMEFKITSYSDPNYKEKEIGVIITCPEFYGADFFKVGGKYEVQIANQTQASFAWSIMNKELLDKYSPGYEPYAISAKNLDDSSK